MRPSIAEELRRKRYNISLDREVARKGKLVAAKNEQSFSYFIENLLLEQIQKEKKQEDEEMALFETIQEKLHEARQKQDSEKIKFWGLVLSEVKGIEKKKVSDKDRKAGATELSDKNILDVLRKLAKSCLMTMQQAKEHNRLKEADQAEAEYKTIMDIIPENEREIDEETLKTAIIEMVESIGEDKSPRLMGKIMGQLKVRFGNRFDGKVASTIAKSILQK